MKIWLDDNFSPPDETWVWYDNALNLIEALKSKCLPISTLSLDHDLGDEREVGNGYMVMEWLENETWTNDDYLPPNISIHTANPVAKQKMNAALSSIKKALDTRYTI